MSNIFITKPLSIRASASIVLYNSNINEIIKLIQNLIFSNIKCIYLIDNSINNNKSDFNHFYNVVYLHNPSNPGFGKSHNIALNDAIKKNFSYHFIINPDIIIPLGTINHLLNYVISDKTIGMIMPKILNLDGTIQFLPKLLPSPLQLFFRKFKYLPIINRLIVNQIELRNINSNLIYNSPILSGCFTLLNLESITKIGLYDERYFMYFEDWDLSRRIHMKYKTIYYPLVSVYHGYASGANKNFKLFIIYLRSAFYFYNKWNWFNDINRKIINKDCLKQF